MRFVVFIIALLACEVAHAQTPLPRSRPHDAPERAARADAAKADTKIASSIPVPRARPADAPARAVAAAKSDTQSVAQAAQTSVPVPRERPASVAPSVTQNSTPAEVAKVEAAPAPEQFATAVRSTKQDKLVVPPRQETPIAPVVSLEGATPPVKQETPPQIVSREEPKAEAPKPEASKPEPPKPEAAEQAAKAEPETKPAPAAAVESAPVQIAREDQKEESSAADSATEIAKADAPPASETEIVAIPMSPLVKESPTPHSHEPEGPMEEPVPPRALPPTPVEPKITRLEPRAVPPEVKNAPTVMPEAERAEPPPAAAPPAAATPPAVDTQVAQLAPAIASLFKKVPRPKPRPLSAWPRPDDTVFRDVTAANPEAECDAAINSGILVAERLPYLGHRGACFVPYAVKVSGIMVGRKRVDLMPPAMLRCGFALAIANWVRADFAPAAESLGAQFVGLRQLDSYNCRTMSSTKRLMSEHSMGNALDVAEVVFAGRHRAHLTDRNTQKTFRAKLRATACKRFKTVLGPGVPQHHDHIHIDLRKHYGPGGICHWNVL